MMEAILLGAGLSKRMGRQKLLLPFGGKTVIETVIDNLRDAGVERICAVLSREVAERFRSCRAASRRGSTKRRSADSRARSP